MKKKTARIIFNGVFFFFAENHRATDIAPAGSSGRVKSMCEER